MEPVLILCKTSKYYEEDCSFYYNSNIVTPWNGILLHHVLYLLHIVPFCRLEICIFPAVEPTYKYFPKTFNKYSQLESKSTAMDDQFFSFKMTGKFTFCFWKIFKVYPCVSQLSLGHAVEGTFSIAPFFILFLTQISPEFS